MRLRAERENSFFCARLLFVSAGASKHHIELEFVQRLLQAFGLGDVRMQRRPVVKRIDVLRDGFRVGMDEQLNATLARHVVAELVHLPELPAGIDVQQRKGWRRGIERLAGKVQHDRAVLAH